MSGTDANAGEQPTEKATDPDQAGEGAEKIARLVLTVVAGLALWGLVAAFPYIAYVVVGVLGTLGWQKTRARLGARRAPEDEDEASGKRGPDALDAIIALHALSRGNNVLLTALRDELELPDTKAVKALLDEGGVPWKGVRTPDGNGPGVHKDDIPPMVSPASDAHGGGCCCRSGDNTNTNNTAEAGTEKGIRVDRTDDGLRIHDLRSDDRHGSARN